jgi:hypothetical protein
VSATAADTDQAGVSVIGVNLLVRLVVLEDVRTIALQPLGLAIVTDSAQEDPVPIVDVFGILAGTAVAQPDTILERQNALADDVVFTAEALEVVLQCGRVHRRFIDVAVLIALESESRTTLTDPFKVEPVSRGDLFVVFDPD